MVLGPTWVLDVYCYMRFQDPEPLSPLAGVDGFTGEDGIYDLGSVFVQDPKALLKFLTPWNTFVYNNPFGKHAADSSTLYGVEPWNYYLKNMTLSFNIFFPLAVFGVFITWAAFLRRNLLFSRLMSSSFGAEIEDELAMQTLMKEGV